jgi:hypothetical protein
VALELVLHRPAEALVHAHQLGTRHVPCVTWLGLFRQRPVPAPPPMVAAMPGDVAKTTHRMARPRSVPSAYRAVRQKYGIH